MRYVGGYVPGGICAKCTQNGDIRSSAVRIVIFMCKCAIVSMHDDCTKVHGWGILRGTCALGAHIGIVQRDVVGVC